MATADLNTSQQEMLDLVTLLPLVSAGELAALRRITDSLVHSRLRGLLDRGVLESHGLGCSAQRPQRYHLSLEAQRDLDLEQASWHQPGLLMHLLERLPSLEAIYRMVAEVQDQGELVDFQWLADDAVAGGALDAAARYEQGWVALVYLGALRSEKNVEEVVQSIGVPIAELGIGDPNPRPGLVAVATADAWTSELVARVLNRHQLGGWFRLYSVASRRWYWSPRPSTSLGWIRQPVYRRQDTMDTWQARLKRSPWAAEAMRDPANLSLLARPGLRALLGERECNRLFRGLMRQLARESLAERLSRERPAGQLTPEEGAERVTREEENPAFTRDETVRQGAMVVRQYGTDLPGDDAPAREARNVLGRLASALENPVSVADIATILGRVVEWPGITTPMLRLELGEGPKGRRTQRACAHLADIGLLVSWTDDTHGARGVRRFRASDDCLNLMARSNRASRAEIETRFRVRNWRDPDQVEQHEYGLLELVEQFMGAGCLVVNGVREYEAMGEAGALAPDALVHLAGGVFGDGWYRIEYELSATGEARIEQKLNGYASPLRRDSWPLLAVCRNDQAERNFRAKGQTLGLTGMLTTTVARLRRYRAVGNDQCWSLYGQPVALLDGPATDEVG